MTTSYSKIQEIANSIDLDEVEYDNIGIRIQSETHGLKVGDVVEHCSYVWDDGNETDEQLDGVCAVSVRSVQNHSNYGSDWGGYPGNVVVILGSNYCEGGNDVCEIIMRDAIVLGIMEVSE